MSGSSARGRISADRKDHERLTDLLTVYFGFGVFTTNAALRFGETARGFSVQPSANWTSAP